MERIQFNGKAGTVLTGQLTHADSGDAVVMVHGFLGDKEGGGLFRPAAEALRARQWGSLRFDQSGCGESTDCLLSPAAALQDVVHAIELMRAIGYRRIVLWGHGLGARYCLPWHAESVSMVLSNAELLPFSINLGSNFGRDAAASLKRDGFVKHYGEVGPRRQHRLSAKLLESLSSFSASAYLRRLSTPTVCLSATSNEADSRMQAELEKELPQGCQFRLPLQTSRTLEERRTWLIARAVEWIVSRSVAVAPASAGSHDRAAPVLTRADDRVTCVS